VRTELAKRYTSENSGNNYRYSKEIAAYCNQETTGKCRKRAKTSITRKELLRRKELTDISVTKVRK